jgi:hypothetical protein
MSAHVESSSHVSAVAAPPASPPRPTCSEQSHDALKADLATWRALPVDDYWFCAGALHEVRRCPRCGSSLMRRIEIVDLRYPDAA